NSIRVIFLQELSIMVESMRAIDLFRERNSAIFSASDSISCWRRFSPVWSSCSTKRHLKLDRVLTQRRSLSLFASNPKAYRSEEHTSELQSRFDLVCRLLLEKKKNNKQLPKLKTSYQTYSYLDA